MQLLKQHGIKQQPQKHPISAITAPDKYAMKPGVDRVPLIISELQ